MQLNVEQVRDALQAFQFRTLLVDILGWNNPARRGTQTFEEQGSSYTVRHLAELAGVVVAEIQSGGAIPDARTREALQKQLAQEHFENIAVFTDAAQTQSLWRWVKREGGKQFPREHTFFKGQPGDLFLSKISGILFDFSDIEQGVSLVQVNQRIKHALDVETVTRKFYGEFETERVAFTNLIQGIDNERDRAWYASVLLNRLMFIYFLQAKRMINNGQREYLQNHLQDCPFQFGHDAYYREFLRPLFFQGFALPPEQRTNEAKALLGTVPYLNGSLFLEHPIEKRWSTIQVPDQAFANLYALFRRYSWNLNDTPGGEDDEISPDVLGYIFEKFINQKAFGAYYTRPEITEYLCEQTIHRLILDKINTGEPIPGVPIRAFENVGDLLLNLDAGLCRRLLRDVLPNLTLLDPACGSGAFLIAAMKTLVNLYGALVGWIETHNDRELRNWLDSERGAHRSLNYHIKREIIVNNLYGVDIMEEATEIARLRLFLALVASARTVDELEPLPNIDFNILSGNSLIGLLRVNDADFEKRNAQGNLFRKSYRELLAEKNRQTNAYRAISGYRADTSALRDSIEALKSEARGTLNEILLQEFQDTGARYEQATWDDAQRKEGRPVRRPLTAEDMAALRPFHWGYEFDHILHERGGFDAILANPPWEIFKPNAKEFFMEHSDVVTKNKMTIKEFEEKQGELLENSEVRVAWLNYLSQFPHLSVFYRNAAQYRNQISLVNGKRVGTDINLYKLFVEQCFNLLRTGGQCGIVLPSGLYTDLGTKQIREMLFGETQVTGLFCFENRRIIFEGVDSRFKFIVLTYYKSGKTNSFPAAFMRHDVAELRDFPRRGALHISIELVRRLSPDSLSVMEFKNETDITIAEKMLKFPLLGERLEGTWNLALTREFDMTNDSRLFRTEPAPGRLPLYEGKMIHQFRHDFAQPRYWVDEQEGRHSLLRRIGDNGQQADYQKYRIGFRDVARSTDERTMISSVIPRQVFSGNTLITSTHHYFGQDLVQIVGLLNSFVVDYFLRQKVNAHCNMFYVYQTPLPRLA